MSPQTVETILSKAMNDAALAESLFANPEQALTGYDLTVEEIASLKDLAREDLGKMAQATPEERRSFGWYNHNESALMA